MTNVFKVDGCAVKNCQRKVGPHISFAEQDREVTFSLNMCEKHFEELSMTCKVFESLPR